MSRRHILLFKLGALGDVLMTTPLARQLRRAHADARIDYLVGARTAAVLENNPHLDRVHTFDEDIFYEKKIGAWTRLVQQMRKEQYDTVYVLDKHWAFHLTARAFGAPERVGFDRDGALFLTDAVPYGAVRHEITYYLLLARTAGEAVDVGDVALELPIEEDERAAAERLLEEHGLRTYYVLVNSGGDNPGEESTVRRMPDELFEEVVQGLAKNRNVVFMGSANERSYYERYDYNTNTYNLAGQTTIQQAAAIIEGAQAVLTTDNGLMHVASAANNRIVSVFGPTDPARKAPLHEEATAIWEDQDTYEEEYEVYGKQPAAEKRWFSRINAEEVVRIVCEDHR